MIDPTAEAVTAAIVALPGIRGIFPNHPVSALALTLISDHRQHTTALIQITTTAETAAVHARLALDRATSTALTLRHVRDELALQLPNRALELHIEIAYID